MPVSWATAMASATFSSVRGERPERELTMTETLLWRLVALERNTRSSDTSRG